jgi:hypothetical protein
MENMLAGNNSLFNFLSFCTKVVLVGAPWIGCMAVYAIANLLMNVCSDYYFTRNEAENAC